jgi:hypothetical protein
VLRIEILELQDKVKELLAKIRGLDKAISQQATFNGGRLNQRFAVLYSERVKDAILSGNVPNKPDYNERYAEWKRKYFPSAGPWQLKMDLVNAISVFQSGGRGWVGGIPGGVMDSGGKSWFGTGNTGKPKEIAMYAAVNEERYPLFAPILNDMIDEFGLIGKQTLNQEIGGYWKWKY